MNSESLLPYLMMATMTFTVLKSRLQQDTIQLFYVTHLATGVQGKSRYEVVPSGKESEALQCRNHKGFKEVFFYPSESCVPK